MPAPCCSTASRSRRACCRPAPRRGGRGDDRGAARDGADSRRRSSRRMRCSAASALPGQIVSATALLARHPRADREEIRAALAGNICRCGAYPKIERAILRASGQELAMRPSFVRTQREMEGRFEDVWALVDEDDDVETWPESAELQVVGQPATRQDGPLADERCRALHRRRRRSRGCSRRGSSARRSPAAASRASTSRPPAPSRRPCGAGAGGPVHHGRRSSPHGRAALGRRPVAAVAADTRDALAEGVAALALESRSSPRSPRRRSRRAAVHGGAARDRPRRSRRRRSRVRRCSSS